MLDDKKAYLDFLRGERERQEDNDLAYVEYLKEQVAKEEGSHKAYEEELARGEYEMEGKLTLIEEELERLDEYVGIVSQDLTDAEHDIDDIKTLVQEIDENRIIDYETLDERIDDVFNTLDLLRQDLLYLVNLVQKKDYSHEG